MMKHHSGAKRSFANDTAAERGAEAATSTLIAESERVRLAEELALCLSVQIELNASILRRVLLLAQVQDGEELLGVQEAALAHPRRVGATATTRPPRRGAVTRATLRSGDGERLSAREGDVLRAVAMSKSNKEIGRELGISFKTVEKHRQAVMNKLDIHDIAGLTRFAIETGAI